MSLFLFPRDKKERRKWLKAIQRKNVALDDSSRVCSWYSPNGKEAGPTRFQWTEGRPFQCPGQATEHTPAVYEEHSYTKSQTPPPEAPAAAAVEGDTGVPGQVEAHGGDPPPVPVTDIKTEDGEDFSDVPRVSSGFTVPGVSMATADACSADSVLTQAMLRSQEQIVRAVGGINERLDRLINVLSGISDALNGLK